MRRIALFPVSILFCLGLTSTVDAQPRTQKKAVPAKVSQPQQSNKQDLAASPVRVVKVSEETQLATIAGSSVEARNETRFVIISLEFQPGKEPVAADDLQLIGSAEQEFRCAGMGDGRGKYGYCLDPNFKFDRGRIWENEEYFDGLCIERSGIQVAGGTFSTNKPVAVFIVPNNVPIRGLALRYKGISVRLPTAK